jgi:hypothetical protein
MRLSFLWAACICLGCASALVRTQSTVPAGIWGAPHVNLDVSATGGRIEYDCAHGTIDGPMSLDSGKRFDVRGTHVREQGGPVPEHEPQGVPARYTGRLEDDGLTITVTLTDSNEVVGTFTLKRNTAGVLRKCL